MPTLSFQHAINQKWIWALQNIGTYTSVMGKPPHAFTFSGDHASISAQESEIQRIIDFFKEWLLNAN